MKWTPQKTITSAVVFCGRLRELRASRRRSRRGPGSPTPGSSARGSRRCARALSRRISASRSSGVRSSGAGGAADPTTGSLSMASFVARRGSGRAGRGSIAHVQPFAASPGARIGRYRVIGALGRGGMAGVYEVEDEAGARFALKAPVPDLTGHRRHAARFAREANALRLLDHPNLVAAVDVFVEARRAVPRDGEGRGRAALSRARRRAARTRVARSCSRARSSRASATPTRTARPPRSQARQHPARRHGRLGAREDHRLRDRQADRRRRGGVRRRRAHEHRHRVRHAARTWRRSRRSAGSSIGARTSTRSARSSSRCSSGGCRSTTPIRTSSCGCR